MTVSRTRGHDKNGVSMLSCKSHTSFRQLALTLEELLLELGLGDFNLDRLVDLLLVSALVVGVVLDGRGEEGVDEGRLAQTRLASNLRVRVRVSCRTELATPRTRL